MSKKFASVLSAGCLMMLMPSCAPTLSSVTSEGVVRIGREAFKPITWSARDTSVTVRQIKVHNEVGVELGLWDPPAKRAPAPRKKPRIVDHPEAMPTAFDTGTEPVRRWWQRK